MRKIVSVIMALMLMLSCTMIANADESNVYDAIREDMIAYGMPAKLVESLPDSEIARHVNIKQENVKKHYYRFTENKNAASAFGTTDDPAYIVEEITEEECMAGLAALETVQPRGTIGESYMSIVFDADPVDGYTRRYLMSASYEWLSTPWFQLVDYFALTIHDCMVVVPDTEYTVEQNDYVRSYSGSTIYTNSWEDSLYASGIGGHCMAVHWIPNDDYTTYFNYRGYISFEAEIAEVGSNGRVNYAAYATYAHQTLVPAFGVSVSLPKSVSATITPTISFDYMEKQENWTHQE